MKRIIYVLVFLFINTIEWGVAQENTTQNPDVTPAKKMVLVGGLQYISNITYAGRRDATSVPIVVPTLTAASTKGLFIGVGGYFNAASDQFSADGLSITPGYIFPLDAGKKVKLSISGTKYFFKKSSSIILSAFEGSADAILSYQPKFAKFSLNNSYQFGRQTNDIINALEITKEIPITSSGKIKVKIDPQVSLYGGTQSFTETYYTESVYQRKVVIPGTEGGLGGLLPGQPGSEQIIQETVTEEKQREVKKYQALSLTSTLPVTLSVSKFQFSFTPYLIVPFNEVLYDANSKKGNYFLFTTGLLYTF